MDKVPARGDVMGDKEIHCVSCEGTGIQALTRSQAQQKLAALSGWVLSEDATSLCREYRFKNFSQALALVNRIGAIAEKEKHHPDIYFGWGYCKVTLQTHSIGGLHDNDFIMAHKIEALTA